MDWGCGPGRLIRHFPSIIEGNSKLYACDYNPASIDWCKENIEGVSFSVNNLNPPLNYEENKFDFIYAISIFTHLSEKMHKEWLSELYRVLAPGGILYFTTHGASFRKKLRSAERALFDKGRIVIRDKTEEGHRSYAAFQPENHLRNLLKEFEVLAFYEGDMISDKPQQDEWILKKN